jgi:hypothetical protein
MTDETHHVNESADKITLTTKIKRGSGTRDQDEIKVKVKANAPVTAAQKLDDTVRAILELQTADTLRQAQPDGDGE